VDPLGSWSRVPVLQPASKARASASVVDPLTAPSVEAEVATTGPRSPGRPKPLHRRALSSGRGELSHADGFPRNALQTPRPSV
jgi:hypothetical protein